MLSLRRRVQGLEVCDEDVRDQGIREGSRYREFDEETNSSKTQITRPSLVRKLLYVRFQRLGLKASLIEVMVADIRKGWVVVGSRNEYPCRTIITSCCQTQVSMRVFLNSRNM